MAVSLLVISGCAPKEEARPSPEEMEKIISEVIIAAEPLMTGWAALDGPTAMKSFSQDMVSCYDTLLLGYDAFAKSWTIYTEARDSIRITEVKRDFIILKKDLVIDTWVGNVDEWMKTGEKVILRPIRYTNLFKKEAGGWKIIFAQSSGIPVIDTLKYINQYRPEIILKTSAKEFQSQTLKIKNKV